ncbi:hypothetical protein L596_024781 [Steinernema carpocapsae]|nr:hypothetical protein L596_024781 [Steinernema carpocapsae]
MEALRSALVTAKMGLRCKMGKFVQHKKPKLVEPEEPIGPNLIDDLPEELLEKIFGYLPAEDVARVTSVSPFWRRTVHNRRSYLPKVERDYLEIQYGRWNDIAKYRRAKIHYPHQVCTYELSKNLGSATQKKMDKVPLAYITEHCSFQVVLLNVQLLNGDLRPLLNFKNIKARRILINVSHPSLQVRPLIRYMSQLINDLTQNRRVEMVNFIFSRHHSPEILNLLKPFASADTHISVQVPAKKGYAV